MSNSEVLLFGVFVRRFRFYLPCHLFLLILNPDPYSINLNGRKKPYKSRV
jgi:hypothetical protein